MDYKNLLTKYINHVERCGGTNFLSYITDTWIGGVDFTEEEIKELEEIGRELNEKQK